MYVYDKMVEVFLFFLLPPLLSLVPLLAWPIIPLFLAGATAWLVSIVILLIGMMSICECELLYCIFHVELLIIYLLESAFSEYYQRVGRLSM